MSLIHAALAGMLTQPEPNDAFELTVETTTADETVTLGNYGTTDVYIDWGDGTAVENVTGAAASHEYAVAGEYSVSITGYFGYWNYGNYGSANHITSVTNLGDVLARFPIFIGAVNMVTFIAGDTTTQANNMAAAFSLLPVLETVDLENVPSGSSSWSTAFKSTSSLNTVILPKNGTVATRVSSLFQSSNVSSVTNFEALDTSTSEDCAYMGYGAANLDLDVSVNNWSAATTMALFMGNSAFSTTNYDKFLIAVESANTPESINFNAGSAKYSVGAATTARTNLGNDHSWTFVDGGQA